MAFTAGWRSSNNSATKAESRSSPRVSWLRSLEPIEKPSKRSRCLAARTSRTPPEHFRHAPGRSEPFLPTPDPPPRECGRREPSRSHSAIAPMPTAANGTTSSSRLLAWVVGMGSWAANPDSGAFLGRCLNCEASDAGHTHPAAGSKWVAQWADAFSLLASFCVSLSPCLDRCLRPKCNRSAGSSCLRPDTWGCRRCGQASQP